MLPCAVRADTLLATLITAIVILAPPTLYDSCWFQVWIALLAAGILFATVTCDCLGLQWGLPSCAPWQTLEMYIYYANLLSAGIALATRLAFRDRRFPTVATNMVLLTFLFTRFVDGNTGVTVFVLGLIALASALTWFLMLFVQGSPFTKHGLLVNVAALLTPQLIFASGLLRWWSADEYVIQHLTMLEVLVTVNVMGLLIASTVALERGAHSDS